MKSFLILLLTATSVAAAPVSGHLGLEMYSLRVTQMMQGWRPALDQVKQLGFTSIEGGLPRNVSVDRFKAELASRGITIISMGCPYERLQKDIGGAVAEAKALGVKYVMVSWIPHQDGVRFTDDAARKAAADFNTWGAAFRAAGIIFAYHFHGYEFDPNPDGTTPFDVIVHETHPGDVNFEMDVFWVTHGGQNPVALLEKYPDRWKLMHIKDMRKGTKIPVYTGHAPGSDDVPVGTGITDWPAVFREANAVGVQWYFIEDESNTSLTNIPKSKAYIDSLGM
jgi:sugar phosphate isomerase/epimerase